MSQKEVVLLMASSRSESEWDANCDEVKRRCNGYPSFWFKAVILSGLAQRTLSAFGSSAKIKVGLD